MEDRVQPLVIKDLKTGDPVYTLEFNRESVRFAERQGFDVGELLKYPVTNIPNFFFYAFRMHHKNVARSKTDEILEAYDNKKKLLERLIELYNATTISLIDETDEKNVRYGE